MKRMWGLAAVALVGLLAACGAGPTPPRDDRVELFVTVGPDGSATADVFLNSMADSPQERRATGDEVGRLLFPEAGAVTTLEGNGVSTSNVTVRASHVYPRAAGPDAAGQAQPRLDLRTEGAVAWLLAHGAQSVAVLVTVPAVDTSTTWEPAPRSGRGTGTEPWAWEPATSAAAAPHGVVRLSASPWLGWLGLLVVMMAWGALVVSVLAVRRGRRLLAVGAASVPLTAFAAVLAAPGLSSLADHLGVSGQLDGSALELARRAPASLLLAVVAAVAAIWLATRRRDPASGEHSELDSNESTTLER